MLCHASAQCDNAVLMTWMLQDSTVPNWPTSYEVECFSEGHEQHIEISVNNDSFSVQLNQMDLLPFTP